MAESLERNPTCECLLKRLGVMNAAVRIVFCPVTDVIHLGFLRADIASVSVHGGVYSYMCEPKEHFVFLADASINQHSSSQLVKKDCTSDPDIRDRANLSCGTWQLQHVILDECPLCKGIEAFFCTIYEYA